VSIEFFFSLKKKSPGKIKNTRTNYSNKIKKTNEIKQTSSQSKPKQIKSPNTHYLLNSPKSIPNFHV